MLLVEFSSLSLRSVQGLSPAQLNEVDSDSYLIYNIRVNSEFHHLISGRMRKAEFQLDDLLNRKVRLPEVPGRREDQSCSGTTL